MATKQNCAIHFFSDAFGPSSQKIFGREIASRGFLRSFIRHSGLGTFYCCTPSPTDFERFRALVKDCGSTAQVDWITYANLDRIGSPGCLYQSDPCIADLAWHRLRLGPAALSLCGVTHTLCSTTIMDAIGNLLMAPVEPWDALICTSHSAKAVVEHVLESYREYLGSRFSCNVPVRIQLPVIPLGVDCDAFQVPTDGSSMRAEVRGQLGIGSDDIAILYVGRLSYHAKSHPLPMYLAAEEVARRTRKSLHLIHFGWFSNPGLKSHFMEAARALCPGVTAHFLDERQDWSQAVWQAADIFMSLSDNVQETFGITPLEAMAAGLPQIVTDWNGYRDTVRHGTDGFRVPTVMPPPGAGDELAARNSVGIDNYDNYVGNTSQSTAVDVASCIAALERLVMSKELRRTMGAAGRERARATFDWSVIIASYQELWGELAARRQAAQQANGKKPSRHPLREDPFSVFSGYATGALDEHCIVDLGPSASPSRRQQLFSLSMNNFAAALLLPNDEIAALVNLITDEAPMRVGDLLENIPAEQRAIVLRTLGWLAKMDVIRVLGLTSSGSGGFLS